MLKRTAIFLFLFLGTISMCFADTVYLKNGSKIEGKIVQRTGSMVKIDISGVTITYYMDEIERVEGGESAQAPAASASAPVSASSPAVTTPSMNAVPAASAGVPAVGKPPKELVLRYLNLSGTAATLDQMFQEMISNSNPQDAGRLQQAYDLGEIMEVLVPIYQKHFTEDEMRKLIAFYQSPVARKLNETTPLIVKDTLDATMLYFRNKLPPRASPEVSENRLP